MASAYITIVSKGLLTKRPVRWLPDKRHRKTLLHWKMSCASKAVDAGCFRYVARFKNQWHVLNVNHPTPIRSFDTEDAAVMWLLLQETR